LATSGVICASEAPETALDDDAVVGAETARATVEAAEEDDEEGVEVRPLRGEATATAGLAQAVRARCWDAGGAAERGATTTPERAVLAANILELLLSLVSVGLCFSLFLFSEGSDGALLGDAGKAQKGEAEFRSGVLLRKG